MMGRIRGSGHFHVKHRLECRGRVIESESRRKFLKKVQETLIREEPNEKNQKLCNCSLNDKFDCQIRNYCGSYWFVEKHLTSPTKPKMKWSLRIECKNCLVKWHDSFQKWTYCALLARNAGQQQSDVVAVDNSPRAVMLEDESDDEQLIQDSDESHDCDLGGQDFAGRRQELDAIFCYIQKLERRLCQSKLVHVDALQAKTKDMMEMVKDMMEEEEEGGCGVKGRLDEETLDQTDEEIILT